MLRFMTPYLLLASLFVIVGGIGYGSGALDVLGAYAAVFLATIIAGAGYARWDERQHPHHDH
jgi:hypothetical protein